MNLHEWGLVSFNEDHNKATITTKTSISYNVDLVDNKNVVSVLSNGKLLFSFIDELFNYSDLSSFKRIINKVEVTYHNGKVVLKEFTRKCKFIKKIRIAQYRSKNFLTMDLETRSLKDSNGDDLMKVVSISIFDGEKYFSFYINNFKSESEMVLEAFKTICIRKYKGYKVYLHNFSYFDSVFYFLLYLKIIKLLLCDEKDLLLS